MGERVRTVDPIVEALKSGKVDDFLMTKYVFDGKRKKPEDDEPMVGLVVKVDSSDIELPGVLSKGERHQLLFVHYSDIPAVVANPNVTWIDWGDDDLVKLVQSSTSDEITLGVPWDGPKGDEWDSPDYSSFWNGAEQFLNKRVQTLQKIGKKVKFH